MKYILDSINVKKCKEAGDCLICLTPEAVSIPEEIKKDIELVLTKHDFKVRNN